MTRLLACALAALVVAGPARAQALTGTIGGLAGAARSRARVSGVVDASSGAVIGAEGRAGLGRVSVDLLYLQGTLSPASGTGESRDYVEGEALLTVVTLPGVTLRVGPRAHAYVSSAGTQRWVFWTGHVRGEQTLLGPAISGFVEVWAALSADVNVSETFGSARGGVAGMTVRLPDAPFYGRLSYSVAHARMGDGARLETVEGLSLVVGFGRR